MATKPSHKQKSPNHPTNIVRNILVGAVTTILGSTCVYFITNSSKNSHSDFELMLMTKDATVNAWKSYVTFENLYTKKSLVITQDLMAQTINFDEYITQNALESKKFTSSIDELITKKNIDKDFVEALKSRLENEKEALLMVSRVANSFKSIRDSSLADEEKLKLFNETITKWGAQSKSFTDRSIADVEEVAKTISERYGQTFAMTDFTIYNMVKRMDDSLAKIKASPGDNQKIQTAAVTDTLESIKEVPPTTALLTGKWNANPPNGADIDLVKNGKFFWHVLSNGDHISGTWKFAGGKLNLYPVNDETGKKATWTFDLSQVRPDLFTMKLTKQPYNAYVMVRQQPK